MLFLGMRMAMQYVRWYSVWATMLNFYSGMQVASTTSLRMIVRPSKVLTRTSFDIRPFSSIDIILV